jgi:hypothetical protein
MTAQEIVDKIKSNYKKEGMKPPEHVYADNISNIQELPDGNYMFYWKCIDVENIGDC